MGIKRLRFCLKINLKTVLFCATVLLILFSVKYPIDNEIIENLKRKYSESFSKVNPIFFLILKVYKIERGFVCLKNVSCR